MNIVFFNNKNNGDIHYSREFVKYCVSEIYYNIKNCQFFYAHTKAENLINDIENLQFIPFTNQYSQTQLYSENNNNIFINTWIGCENRKYFNCIETDLDCSLESNYRMWKDIIQRINYSLNINIMIPEREYFIPTINFEKYQIKNIKLFFENTVSSKNVFWSNPPCLSGQANNFDFSNIVGIIAKNNPSKTFFVTNKISNLNLQNVIFTENIIKKLSFSDLNENGYISTFCDYLIGRGSGPMCFAHIKQNYNNSNKKMILFGNNKTTTIWSDIYKCQYIWSKAQNLNEIENIIQKNLGD